MGTTEPEAVESPGTGGGTAWSDDPLFALLDELRGEGFALGVGDYLQAQLAAAACHRDGLGHDPRRLRNYLAPVLCSSPEQQQIFYRRFDAWWLGRAGGRKDELPPTPPPEKKLAEVVRRTRPWKWWAATLLGAALVTGVLAWWSRPAIVAETPAIVYPPLKKSTPQGRLGTRQSARPSRRLTLDARVIDPDGKPVPGATLRGNLIAVLEGHTRPAVGTAFSQDGRRVATTSFDGTVRLWDAATGRLLGKPLQHGTNVWAVAFSPDGQRVVTAADDGVREWTVDGYSQLVIVREQPGRVLGAAFSPDGRHIVTASDDGTVRIWVSDASEKPVVLRGHRSAAMDAAFSPDGLHIVTASSDGTARVWSKSTDGVFHSKVLRGHKNIVALAAFSRDGRRIVTGSSDGTAMIWDAETGERLGKPLQHEGAVVSAVFSPEGRRLTTVSRYGLARTWDLTTGEVTGRPWPLGLVMYASISPDRTRVVTDSGGPEARIWSIVSPSDPSTLPSLGTSNEQGEIRLTVDAGDAPGALVFTRPGYHAPPAPFILPANAANGTFQVTLAPLSVLDRLARARPSAQAGLALLPLVFAGPWLAWRLLRRRQLVLERRTTREAQTVASPSFPEPHHELYRGASFARARVEVQRRQRSGAGDLDPEATIEATVQRRGFFTPVYRARFELPAYLVLVDRGGIRDQRARMVDELLDRLQAGNVDLVRFDFDRDPRRASPHLVGGLHRDLEDLAGLYPHHRLAVFSDGAGLTEPAAGRLAPWTRLFAAWSGRALLTPVPLDHWGRRELDLAAAGFAVIPAGEEGIGHLADLWQREEGAIARPLTAPWSPPYPDLLAALPSRFLERHPPRPPELDDLCEELAFYLGPDGYRWLCALAVYPELNWYLTLHLGLLLRRIDGREVLDEATLLELTRLPWLRHGWMPDWLRLRLLHHLAAADEQAVRGWMHDFLEHRESPGSRFHLDIARPPQPEQPPRGLRVRDRLRRWAERMDGRRLIKDLAHTEPRQGALRDQIFVTFLLGKKPSRLQPAAPRAWRRWVWEQGLSALGPRTGFILGLTAFLSFAGLGIGGPGLEWLAERLSPAPRSKVTVTEAVRLQASYGACIEVAVGNGRPLTLAKCADVARQLWRMEPAATSGTFRLRSLMSEGRCMDAQLGLAPCADTPQQAWLIGPSREAAASSLQNVGLDGCLEVSGGQKDPFIGLGSCADLPNQTWKLLKSRPILVSASGI